MTQPSHPLQASDTEKTALQKIDLRPFLAAGQEPREMVLNAVDTIPADGVLVLLAPFRPQPLLALLAKLEKRATDEEITPGVWRVCIQPPSSPTILDVRNLPAPEPMQKILETCALLEAGQACIARTPRYPHSLSTRLEERGLQFQIQEELDGSALIHIRKPAT